MGVGKGHGQVKGRLVGDAECHPRLQGFERSRAEGRGKAGERIGLAHDYAVAVPEPGGGEERRPVEVRRELRKVRRRVRVVLDGGIAELRLVPAIPGERGLERDDARCGTGRIVPPDQRQQPRGIIGVRLLLRSEIGFEEIIAVGKAEPRLVEIDGVALGRLQVAVDVVRHDRRIEVVARLSHQAGEVGAARRRADGAELGRNGLRAERGDARFVHEGRIESAGLAADVGRLLADTSSRVIEQLVKIGLHAVRHLEAPRHGRAVGGDHRAFEVLAVGEPEEVVAGFGRAVDRGEVETRRLVNGRVLGQRRRAHRRRADPQCDRNFHCSFSPLGSALPRQG